MSKALRNSYSRNVAFHAAFAVVARLVAEVALAYVAHSRILGMNKVLPLKKKISKRGTNSLMSYRLHTFFVGLLIVLYYGIEFICRIPIFSS